MRVATKDRFSLTRPSRRIKHTIHLWTQPPLPNLIALSFPSRRSLFFWKHPSPDANENDAPAGHAALLPSPPRRQGTSVRPKPKPPPSGYFPSGNMHAPFYLIFM